AGPRRGRRSHRRAGLARPASHDARTSPHSAAPAAGGLRLQGFAARVLITTRCARPRRRARSAHGAGSSSAYTCFSGDETRGDAVMSHGVSAARVGPSIVGIFTPVIERAVSYTDRSLGGIGVWTLPGVIVGGQLAAQVVLARRFASALANVAIGFRGWYGMALGSCPDRRSSTASTFATATSSVASLPLDAQRPPQPHGAGAVRYSSVHLEERHSTGTSLYVMYG
ncbi:MAG: hypothetical protein QOJ19_2192, partial [Acidimicrobiia bacterium]|nr:hypothetical protein [Acidimicrobiia bacterium]